VKTLTFSDASYINIIENLKIAAA